MCEIQHKPLVEKKIVSEGGPQILELSARLKRHPCTITAYRPLCVRLTKTQDVSQFPAESYKQVAELFEPASVAVTRQLMILSPFSFGVIQNTLAERMPCSLAYTTLGAKIITDKELICFACLSAFNLKKKQCTKPRLTVLQWIQ